MQKKVFSHLMVSMILLLSFSLQGCILLAAGAGAATTAVVVHDRRALQTIADDQNIELTANSQANQNPKWIPQSHIVVVAFNHAVLLIGQVPNQKIRNEAQAMVQTLPKVARIYNQLTITAPASAGIRANDAWITARVKTQMVQTKDLHSTQIKVVTENSRVYLLGIINHHQARLAIDVARRVSGIQHVIALFEYTID